MDVRAAAEPEIENLARLWHDGWHDAHGQIVPAELVGLRTVESFAERLRAALAEARVAGPLGDAVGLCIIKDDELYQLYVAAQARGTGVAAALMADAEARLSRRGIRVAWLACVMGNERAASFYEKCGWKRTGPVIPIWKRHGGSFRSKSGITRSGCRWVTTLFETDKRRVYLHRIQTTRGWGVDCSRLQSAAPRSAVGLAVTRFSSCLAHMR